MDKDWIHKWALQPTPGYSYAFSQHGMRCFEAHVIYKGKRHNNQGPAIIFSHVRSLYYYKGAYFQKHEWEKRTSLLAILLYD